MELKTIDSTWWHLARQTPPQDACTPMGLVGNAQNTRPWPSYSLSLSSQLYLNWELCWQPTSRTKSRLAYCLLENGRFLKLRVPPCNTNCCMCRANYVALMRLEAEAADTHSPPAATCLAVRDKLLGLCPCSSGASHLLQASMKWWEDNWLACKQNKFRSLIHTRENHWSQNINLTLKIKLSIDQVYDSGARSISHHLKGISGVFITKIKKIYLW